MGLKVGIVGLPNAGKSTIFNALTKSGIAADNYPFCTIDPNVGIVHVPDNRLLDLENLFKPKSTVNTIIEFVDIAGLVKGASKGEGLGNQFLSHIRDVDAIINVARLFKDDNVSHVEGSINPQRDLEIIEMELLLKDIMSIEKHLEKMKEDLNNMNDIKYVKSITYKEFQNNNFIYNIFTSLREKINAPSRKKRK